MQWYLREGITGRVLLDRNTALHFLDRSGLKRNRQVRLIRNIEYPLDYYLAHVSKRVPPTPLMSPNDTNNSDTELAERKTHTTSGMRANVGRIISGLGRRRQNNR